jgi:hypothetical protein
LPHHGGVAEPRLHLVDEATAQAYLSAFKENMKKAQPDARITDQLCIGESCGRCPP